MCQVLTTRITAYCVFIVPDLHSQKLNIQQEVHDLPLTSKKLMNRCSMVFKSPPKKNPNEWCKSYVSLKNTMFPPLSNCLANCSPMAKRTFCQAVLYWSGCIIGQCKTSSSTQASIVSLCKTKG